MKDLIYALRCSSSGNRTEYKCLRKKCPYYSEEELPEKYKGMADIKRGGKYYADNCDCDKICRDAADALEGYVSMEDDLK